MKKHHICLSPDERSQLEAIARQQKVAARKKLRAQVLLASDEGENGPHEIDTAIAARLPITVRSIEALRAWTCEAGPIEALNPRPSTRVYERKLDGRAEAQLIAISKDDPPVGHDHWTLALLADKLVELRIVDAIDDNTVWRTLKKTSSSLI